MQRGKKKKKKEKRFSIVLNFIFNDISLLIIPFFSKYSILLSTIYLFFFTLCDFRVAMGSSTSYIRRWNRSTFQSCHLSKVILWLFPEQFHVFNDFPPLDGFKIYIFSLKFLVTSKFVYWFHSCYPLFAISQATQA